MKTLSDFGNDGEHALEELLLESKYGSVEQAVASLTVFTHPKIVAQTENKALFRIRRYKEREVRGDVLEPERVVLCDNDSPTRAFLWANNLSKGDFEDVQFNHVYQKSYDAEFYTSLANICVTPAFLSKLTDKNQGVIRLLKFRVYSEYRFLPEGEPLPIEPENYDSLVWAPYLESCADLRLRIQERLRKNSESRIATSIERFGWLFAKNLSEVAADLQ